MKERRNNWKENLGEEARQKQEQREALLIELDQTRREIQEVGLDFKRYDVLKQQQREITAKLAVL